MQLPEEVERELLGSIRRFFDEELELDIGDLKARIVLDFCLAEIGSRVYNHAIADARKYLQERMDDLEGACFEPETGWWDR